MKLTLVLESVEGGVRASLVEEWEETGRIARMAPRVRLFGHEEEALAWARGLARRRGLSQIYLTDNRNPRERSTSASAG